jgi:hypothetical protein
MKLRIELKAAMLIALLILLWLALEFMVGLQDQFIAYHPYVTIIALVIPVIVTRKALITKRDGELHGNITFAQAFKSGVTIALLSAVLAVPTQYIFHYLINPDFFDSMIKYAVANGKSTPEQAANYFNFHSYLLQSVLGTLVVGALVALVLAYMLRTKPAK